MASLSPSRLTLARQRREMTLRELGDRVGCTPAALSQFEKGTRNPSEELLRRIALALSFPLAFFEAAEVDLLESEARAKHGASVASFRSLRSLSARSRERALAGGVLVSELAKTIGSRIRLPVLNLPDLQGETPERAAQLSRATWELGDGPIDNVVHLLESRGVRVFWMRNECNQVDAFSFWKDGEPFVVLGNHKTAERSRRDAAHELAHLLLHLHGDVCGREAEDEAERFASEFLVPSAQFMRECPVDPSREDISGLKRRWRVSRSSIVRRGFELGLISEWHYRSECIAMSQAGRAHEDDPIEREQSIVFTRLLPMFAAAGISLSALAEELCLSTEELLNFIPVEAPERWIATSPGARVFDLEGARRRA